jgi:hypothetical protein
MIMRKTLKKKIFSTRKRRRRTGMTGLKTSWMRLP